MSLHFDNYVLYQNAPTLISKQYSLNRTLLLVCQIHNTTTVESLAWHETSSLYASANDLFTALHCVCVCDLWPYWPQNVMPHYLFTALHCVCVTYDPFDPKMWCLTCVPQRIIHSSLVRIVKTHFKLACYLLFGRHTQAGRQKNGTKNIQPPAAQYWTEAQQSLWCVPACQPRTASAQ